MGHGNREGKRAPLEVEGHFVERETETASLIPGDDGGGGHGSTGGSIWGSTFNLSNSAIGAGILALPFAVRESGLALGILFMVLMSLTLCFTLKILIWTNRIQPAAKSYEKLVWAIFGKKVSILVTASVILTTFGACTGFLVIIADLLPPIVKQIVDNDFLADRRTITIAVSIIGIIPLACLPNFNSLRFSSTMAIVSVTFTVFVVILRSSQSLVDGPSVSSHYKAFNLGLGIFDALPLISFAFGCHMQLIPIFGELTDSHIPSRGNAVIISTNLLCLVLYSLTAIFGYLEFPSSDEGNILKNYHCDDVLVNVARAFLCFVIVCHYPPSNYCCRAALDYLFFPQSKPNTYRRIAWTLLIWGCALTVSIAIPQIDVVFGLIGATANSLIVFIFPALFLVYLHPHPLWEGVKGPLASYLGLTILVLGTLISAVGTVVIVLQNWVLERDGEKSHDC